MAQMLTRQPPKPCPTDVQLDGGYGADSTSSSSSCSSDYAVTVFTTSCCGGHRRHCNGSCRGGGRHDAQHSAGADCWCL